VRTLVTSLRPLYFVSASVRDDMLKMPGVVRREFGHALYMAQLGENHASAKTLRQFGPDVLEIVQRHDGDTYRAVYTVRFEDAVYVLHVFQKKSPSGRKVAQRDIDTVESRLRLARVLHQRRRGGDNP